jgi:hypothetical protein
MPVGWDAGDTCWNRDSLSYDGHYCARDGDVLGYAYGPWGTQPVHKSLSEICPAPAHPKKDTQEMTFEGLNAPLPDKKTIIYAGDPIEFTLKDKKNKTIEDATVEIRTDTLKTLFSVVSDKTGKISFILDEPGEYRLLVITNGHPHKQLTVLINPKETTTTTSTTTTTIPKTTSSTTIKLAHFLSLNAENHETTTIAKETTTSVREVEIQTTGEGITGNVVAKPVKKKSNIVYAIIIAGLLLGAFLLKSK